MTTAAPNLLVGDIGGTHTRLAIYDYLGKKLLSEAVFPSREHPRFEAIAERFLAAFKGRRPEVAALGVAGPVERGHATVTNLPWRLDERLLEKRLAIESVRLINDLVAIAVGSLHTPPAGLIRVTKRGPRRRGHNIAVMAAGTGLGEARLLWDGERHLPFASEGGHADFAPRTSIEIELWQYLTGRQEGRVSYERVLSGNGLGALYDFFAAREKRVSAAMTRRLAEGDRNAAIAELGLSRALRPAARAVDLFVTIYGAEAGNLALRELSIGGVMIAGNIGKHLIPPRAELFLAGFRGKGRFASRMDEIPIAIVDDPMVGVRGALAMAKERAAQLFV